MNRSLTFSLWLTLHIRTCAGYVGAARVISVFSSGKLQTFTLFVVTLFLNQFSSISEIFRFKSNAKHCVVYLDNSNIMRETACSK